MKTQKHKIPEPSFRFAINQKFPSTVTPGGLCLPESYKSVCYTVRSLIASNQICVVELASELFMAYTFDRGSGLHLKTLSSWLVAVEGRNVFLETKAQSC